jgi:hypothetical protein
MQTPRANKMGLYQKYLLKSMIHFQDPRETYLLSFPAVELSNVPVARNHALTSRNVKIQLTPWQRVLLENPQVAQLFKIIIEFRGTRQFITVRHSEPD